MFLGSSFHCLFGVLTDFVPYARVEPLPAGKFGFDARGHKVAGGFAHGFDGFAGCGGDEGFFLEGEFGGGLFEGGGDEVGGFGTCGWL